MRCIDIRSLIAHDTHATPSNNKRVGNFFVPKSDQTHMKTAENIASFVKALKESGVSISDENLLVERLNKAASANAPVDFELIKIARNSKASGITFTVDPKRPSDKFVKAFLDHDLDGFTYNQFIPYLKLP